MKYTELKSIKADDVIKAAEKLANLAMNLAFRGVVNRDVSVLSSLNTDQLRRLPAELRLYFPVKKASKEEDRYIFAEKKAVAIKEKLGILPEVKPTFEQFAQLVQAQVEVDNPEVTYTVEEIKGRAAAKVAASIRGAFRAGLSVDDLRRILAKVEVEARDTPSEAPKAAKVEAPVVAQPAEVTAEAA